jgi:hypothetical protein
MNSSINSLAAEFDAAALWAKRLTEQYPADAWSTRLGTGWAATDCLAHLNLTAEAFWPVLEQAWQAAQSMPSSGQPYRLRLMERFLLWFLEPPYRQTVKTPPAFQPAVQPREEVLAQFQDHSARLAAFVLSLDGLAIDRPLIVSPFDARVRYSLWAGLRIMAAHHRRHLWQAERTLARAAGRSA